MAHLSTGQLVDIAEGAQPDSSAPHLRTCASCRKQLEDLRAMMAAAADVEIPEPSPLFWDHFSARVHQAVEAERQAPATGLSWAWLQRPLVWAPGLAAVLLAVAMLSRVGPRVDPASPGTPAVVSVEATVEPFVIADDLSAEAAAKADPSLSLVADLAADLDWDAVVEAGLTTHVGMNNDVLLQLNDAERRELRELLQMELGQLGRRGA